MSHPFKLLNLLLAASILSGCAPASSDTKIIDLVKNLQANGFDGQFESGDVLIQGALEGTKYHKDKYHFEIYRYTDADQASKIGMHTANLLTDRRAYNNGDLVLVVSSDPTWGVPNAKILIAFMDFRS